jgi:poly(hydroxyalkanoate) depolymerase family esterase
MKIDFAEAMRQATLATRARDLGKATSIIKDALAGRLQSCEPDEAPARPPEVPSFDADKPATDAPTRKRWPLGDVVRFLRGVRTAPGNLANPSAERAEPVAPPPAPEGANFVTRSFACPAGKRSYKLYVPGSATPPRGLIVMLHGCKQNPDDFATGTNMNAVAEARGLMVAYPGQTRSANMSSCWNWFNPADQRRDAGEPAIIAGITREIVDEFGLDRRRVFVAGLSAGGAMAAVLGATYPDLYAAVGVHSGLAYQAANDVMSAFAAMKGTGRVSPPAPLGTAAVRTIIFHGDLDTTVNPTNADRVADAALAGGEGARARREFDGLQGGRRCATTVFTGPDGMSDVELWRIDGAGHAWSGGNPKGSFADSKGPDASAEMARFFLGEPASA